MDSGPGVPATTETSVRDGRSRWMTCRSATSGHTQLEARSWHEAPGNRSEVRYVFLRNRLTALLLAMQLPGKPCATCVGSLPTSIAQSVR